jgi:hypothetical protein
MMLSEVFWKSLEFASRVQTCLFLSTTGPSWNVLEMDDVVYEGLP